MQPKKRKTKVVWSIDGDQITNDFAGTLADKEVDALRIVYRPLKKENICSFLDNLHKKRDKSLPHIPIMVDLARQSRATLATLDETKEASFGDEFRFVKNPEVKAGDSDLLIQCEQLKEVFVEGVQFYIGYGNVVLRADKVTNEYVQATVEKGGKIHPGSELHVPSSRKGSELESFDTKLIKELVERKVDYLTLPGVPDPTILRDFRARVLDAGITMPWLLLRIDSKQMQNIAREVIEDVDGLFISRREIALTADAATVPMITKEMIGLCNDKAKLVVIASEMLASMRYNATPTRAEVSDVANATMDGSDAVVLSEDISEGKFGFRAHELATRIIAEVEAGHDAESNWIKREPEIRDELDAVSFQAYKTARRVNAKAIVCVTEGGNTALRLASFRPPLPIIAVTFSDDVSRKLRMVRGVEGVVLDIDPKLDEVLPTVNELVKEGNWLQPGDKIVFVTVTISPLSREASNLFTVQTIV